MKRIRDRINERLDLEGEADLVGATTAPVAASKGKATKEEYIDSEGVKKSDYIKQAQIA